MLSNDVAAYMNEHYAHDLKRLTEGAAGQGWVDGVSFGMMPPPRLEVYPAFRLMNGFLQKRGEPLLRVVIEGGDRNRFEVSR